MKGPEVVTALRAMINTTTLRKLFTGENFEIKHLLSLINFSMFSRNPFLMPVPYNDFTRYGWISEDLKDLAAELESIATTTKDNITDLEAALCHFHLSKVLKALILTCSYPH